MPLESQPGKYRLRIAVAFGDTILAEQVVSGRVTLGQSHRSTFILPGVFGEHRRGRRVLIDRKGVHLLEGLGGQLHLDGSVHEIEALRAGGRTVVKLAPEDWGVLFLLEQPAIRLVVQHVRGEVLPPMSRDKAERPWFMSTAVSALAFGLFMAITFLRYDPDRPPLEAPQISERMATAMFSPPPQPPPEEEAEVSDQEQVSEKQRKRAGDKEGKFGQADKRGPSNIPKGPAAVNVGLVRELNTLADSSTMADLLGTSGQVQQALTGLDQGQLVIGNGSGGMSTKGVGLGGGGEGVGTIHGTGDIDVGGAGASNRAKGVKGSKRPKERKVSVRTGQASVKGQLSKELIDREVRRHRAQITFCYNKQLLRHPNLSGKVVLRWVIGMDGSVRSAKIQTSSLGNQDAESCMVRALESWRFPKPEGGVVQVDYPFIFGTK